MSAVIDVSDRRFISRPWAAAVDPAVTNDLTKGVQVGDTWFNTATGNIWMARSVAAGAAVWGFVPRTWQSGLAVGLANPGHTNRTKLTSIAFAANVLGANGRLDIFDEWSTDAAANNKTLEVLFGAADDLTGTAFAAVVSNSQAGHSFHHVVQNKNATNAQRGALIAANAVSIGSVAGATPTAAIDTTAATYLVFALTLASGTATAALESYKVTLTRPDIGP